MTIPSSMLAVLLSSAVAVSAGCASYDSAPRGGDPMLYGRTYGPAPRLDPNRKISEQDCTQPVVNDGGNLVCK